MHFGTMAKWLETAKLTYACSAHYFDHVVKLNLTSEQQAFLNEIHDPMFKQTVYDFMVNQQFRKDYWVKGARSLSPLERTQGIREQRFMMTVHRADVSLTVAGALGDATLSENIYFPILDLMADHKVRSLGQIEEAVKDKGISIAHLREVVLVLCGNGTLSTVQDEVSIPKAKKHSEKLNALLMLKARASNDITYLTSPVTGGGVMVQRFHQIFILAIQQGKKKPEEWALFVAQLLIAQGQKIVKEGKTLESPEENLAELTTQANEFALKQLPILKALQII
jgi:hypothetical protein